MDLQNRSTQITDYTISQAGERTGVKKFMANVFTYMFVALGVSALFAYLFASNSELLAYLVNTTTGRLNPLGWIVMLAPLGFVLIMSFGYARLSAPALLILFILYSVLTGISLSFILSVYTSSSVLGCFLSAAAMFGVMAGMGYTTNKDLTSFGRIMFMGLIGIIIA